MRDDGRHARPALQRPSVRRNWYPTYCFVLFSVITVFVAYEPGLMHWSLIPLAACGLIIGKDAVAWITGQLDPFDPKGVIAVIGIHLFFLAPLLVVLWGHEYDVAPSPPDWRPWLGTMATFNAVGLLVYLGLSNLVFHRLRVRRRMWVLDENRVFLVLVPALILSGLAQMYLWIRFGGVIGQVATYKSGDIADISGRFKYQLLASAFPILLLILLSALRARRDRNRGRYSVAVFMIVLTFILYFVTDGLRGSRSTTIWTLFWATGIVHFFWRKLSARVLLAGLVPLFMFMFLYGLYKSYGRDVLDMYEETGSVVEMSQRSGRTARRLVIADLSRADIQAFMAYRLLGGGSNYSVQMGATYAEALPRLFIPKAIWAGRPDIPRKSYAAAYLHFNGPAPYSDRFSKVTGLAGEAMLNFHVYGIFLAFAALGVVMGVYRRHMASWPDYDARLYIAPFVANWFLAAIVGDFDNLLAFSITKGLFPLLVVSFMVRRREA
jgi:hypothetical protein